MSNVDIQLCGPFHSTWYQSLSQASKVFNKSNHKKKLTQEFYSFKRHGREPHLSAEEVDEIYQKKDCKSYKPPKRIQCDMSLYNANLISKNEAIADITEAINEWRREEGVSDSIYLLGLDTNNWAITLGHAEMILGTTFANLHMRYPRFFTREYISHFDYSSKPTIVYASGDMEGEDVIDHYSRWTAVEGDKSANIYYVAGGSNKAGKGGECDAFYSLPKSLGERKHVTVVLGGKVCSKIPSQYRVLVGKYEKRTMKGFGSRVQWMPRWECELPSMECIGDMSEKDLEEAQHFLA